MFGSRPSRQLASHNSRGGEALANHDQAKLLALMALEVRKGVALGLRAANMHREPATMGGGYESENTKGYTKDVVTHYQLTSQTNLRSRSSM